MHGLVGSNRRGLSRRTALRAGGASALSFAIGQSAACQLFASQTSPPATAKSIIFLSLYGGSPHQDTFDLKTTAPVDIRGEFEPISTTVPGFQVCEHLPKLANLAHLYSVVRSVTHEDNGHESAFYALMTGWPHPQPNTNARPQPQDHPNYGVLMNHLKPPALSVPGFVIAGGITSTGIGQTAGYLGSGWAPYVVRRDANEPGFQISDLTLPSHTSQERLLGRRDLLAQLNHLSQWEEQKAQQSFSLHHRRAFEMLTSSSMRGAFAIDKESPATRTAYGDHPFGQNLLLARRLVEAGVPIVQVNWRNRGDGGFDTHSNNFNMCKGMLLPKLDGCLSALLIDLEQRGLLEQTLVVAAGEFGRTPKINQNAGRDHWAGCNSMLLAGGGIKRGYIYGSSDRIGAYPATNAVGPWDIYATMLHCFGIDPKTEIKDRFGRPFAITRGSAITDLLS